MRQENVDRDFRNHPSGGPVRLVTDHEFTVLFLASAHLSPFGLA
jgi:hypothetical protein